MQTESGHTVTKFYIGKTYVRRRKKRGGGFIRIRPKRNSTYKKDGIGSRWHKHREEYYGRDGMVVLAIITRKAVPERARSTCKLHQEDYAFALEQALLHHFMVTFPDSRITNDGFASGGTNNRSSKAYAIYMIFRMVQSEPLDTASTDEGSCMAVCGDDEDFSDPTTSVDATHAPTIEDTSKRDDVRRWLLQTFTNHASSAEPHTKHRKRKIRFSDPLVTGKSKHQKQKAQEDVKEAAPLGVGHRAMPHTTTFPRHSNQTDELNGESRPSVESRESARQSTAGVHLNQPLDSMASTMCATSSRQCTEGQNVAGADKAVPQQQSQEQLSIYIDECRQWLPLSFSDKKREEIELLLAIHVVLSKMTKSCHDCKRAREMEQEEEELQEAKRLSLEYPSTQP